MRSSNWSAVNLLRWVEGHLQPVGGQAQYNYTFASRCKAIHGWFDLSGTYHIAYVCEQNVYVDTVGTLIEITPAGGWPAVIPPSQGGYGDLNYGDDLPEGAPTTAYGTPRAYSTILGVDFIPNMWSVDNFGALLLVMYDNDGRLLQWNPAATANANDVQTLTISGGPTGGTFTLAFNGQTTATIAYNATAATVQAALVALANIGAGNVACAGGPLPGAVTITFQGTLGNAPQSIISVAANNLTGGSAPAPTITHTTTGSSLLLTRVGATSGGVSGMSPMGRCFVVTQERFVMIFGMTADGTTGGGSWWRFGWCDQEGLNTWSFASVTNQAGYLDIEPASPIMSAIAGRFGVLMFTAKKAYHVQFLGLPYVYNYVEIGDDATPWSPASITTTSSYVLWTANQGCFSFDGSNMLPVPCPIRTWIDDDIDPQNVREQACSIHMADFNEYWWFYPQRGAPYNTRVAIYNYKEGWWSMGQMSRSAGVTSSYTVQPILADGKIAFQHEMGSVYVHADLPWAETFDLNLAAGGRLATVKQLIPDVSGDPSGLLFSVLYQMTRSLGAPEQQSSRVPIRPDGYVDLRTTGRDIRLRIDVAGPLVQPFTIGQHLIDSVPRGDR